MNYTAKSIMVNIFSLNNKTSQKNNKNINSTSRMFDANNISAGS